MYKNIMLGLLGIVALSCTAPTEPFAGHSVIPGKGSTFSYHCKITGIDEVRQYEVRETGLIREGHSDVSHVDGNGYICYAENGDFVQMREYGWHTFPMSSMEPVIFVPRSVQGEGWYQIQELRIVPKGDTSMAIGPELLNGKAFKNITHHTSYKTDGTYIGDYYDTTTTIWSHDIGMPLYDEKGSGPFTMQLESYEIK